ncbi:hypothetical protein GH714_020804 [Hevea brasiliensis]|uniref:Ubiquitin-like domain-containing protein n=1 Tax=Hevea brasiliensis TaxID=3981 RepID=A0A6A6KT39_HEVBR|nr:hypothetical protein GH714_020804 [Hevea brasiliensis]
MQDSSKFFQIFVKLLDGKTATLRFTASQVDGLAIKRRVFEITKIPTHCQRLIYSGHNSVRVPQSPVPNALSTSCFASLAARVDLALFCEEPPPKLDGERKLGESDSEDTDEDSSDEENEKSIVLNNENHSNWNNEAEGGSESVTGGKQDGEFSGGVLCESGSEGEKDATVEQNLKSIPQEENVPSENDGLAEPEIHEEAVLQSCGVTCLGTAESSGIDAVKDKKLDNVESDSQPYVTTPASGDGIESRPVTVEAVSDFKSASNGETVAVNVRDTDLEKPLNFDDFNSAAEMEVC